MKEKKISQAVIKRLPRYYRYLAELVERDVPRISSRELARSMGTTASQVRQDLNNFGGFGQQGYGYNIKSLFEEIGKILGTDRGFEMVIVGAGRLGRALANYPNFIKRGYRITGIFDIDENIIGQKINGIEIMHLEELIAFSKNNKVDIAALTVPISETDKVKGIISRSNIKGVWNFLPRELELSDEILVENVHLSDSLMVLGYGLTSDTGNGEVK